MTQQIKSALTRSPDTLLADMVGVVSLVVMLLVGLSLPALIRLLPSVLRRSFAIALSQLRDD